MAGPEAAGSAGAAGAAAAAAEVEMPLRHHRKGEGERLSRRKASPPVRAASAVACQMIW